MGLLSIKRSLRDSAYKLPPKGSLISAQVLCIAPSNVWGLRGGEVALAQAGFQRASLRVRCLQRKSS